MISIIQKENLPLRCVGASEIGTVVNHYLQLGFKSYSDINTLYSKFLWTQDELQKYNNFISNKLEFAFSKGEKFENEVFEAYADKLDKSEVEIEDFNATGLVLYCDENKLRATPDAIIKYKKSNNINIIEIKAGVYKDKKGVVHKMFSHYKYQLATQYYLIREALKNQDKQEGSVIERGFKCFIQFNDELVLISLDEIELLITNILYSIKLFWTDVSNANFTFIESGDAIKKLTKNVKEESDVMMQEKLILFANLKNQIKAIESIELQKDILERELTEYYKEAYVKIEDYTFTFVRRADVTKDKSYYNSEIRKLHEKIELCNDKLSELESGAEVEVKKGSQYIKIN